MKMQKNFGHVYDKSPEAKLATYSFCRLREPSKNSYKRTEISLLNVTTPLLDKSHAREHAVYLTVQLCCEHEAERSSEVFT